MRIVSLHLDPKTNAATCALAMMEEGDHEVRNPKEDNISGLQLTIIFIINYSVDYFVKCKNEIKAANLHIWDLETTQCLVYLIGE